MVEGSRRDYQASRDHLLKYIQHPEALNELAIDPLADDPEVRIFTTSLPASDE